MLYSELANSSWCTLYVRVSVRSRMSAEIAMATAVSKPVAIMIELTMGAVMYPVSANVPVPSWVVRLIKA